MMGKALVLFVFALVTNTAYGVSIKNAWYRIPVPGARVTAGYFTIVNNADQSDRLVSATGTLAATLELHDMTMKDGEHKMIHLPSVDIPAKSQVEFKPGGKHLMFIDLNSKVDHQKPASVELRFERAGAIEVMLEPKSGM